MALYLAFLAAITVIGTVAVLLLSKYGKWHSNGIEELEPREL